MNLVFVLNSKHTYITYTHIGHVRNVCMLRVKTRFYSTVTTYVYIHVRK